MDIITEFIIPSMIAILASVFFGIAAPLFKQSTQKLGPITIDMFKQNKLEVIKQILNKYFITASALQIFGWLIFLGNFSGVVGICVLGSFSINDWSRRWQMITILPKNCCMPTKPA